MMPYSRDLQSFHSLYAAPFDAQGNFPGFAEAITFSPSGRWVIGNSMVFGAGFVYDRQLGEMRFDSLGDDGTIGLVRIARDADILVTAGAEQNLDEASAKLTAMRLETGEQLWSITIKSASSWRTDTRGSRLRSGATSIRS